MSAQKLRESVDVRQSLAAVSSQLDALARTVSSDVAVGRPPVDDLTNKYSNSIGALTQNSQQRQCGRRRSARSSPRRCCSPALKIKNVLPTFLSSI